MSMTAAKRVANLGKERLRGVPLRPQGPSGVFALRGGCLKEGQVGMHHIPGRLVTHTSVLILPDPEELVGNR